MRKLFKVLLVTLIIASFTSCVKETVEPNMDVVNNVMSDNTDISNDVVCDLPSNNAVREVEVTIMVKDVENASSFFLTILNSTSDEFVTNLVFTESVYNHQLVYTAKVTRHFKESFLNGDNVMTFEMNTVSKDFIRMSVELDGTQGVYQYNLPSEVTTLNDNKVTTTLWFNNNRTDDYNTQAL